MTGITIDRLELVVYLLTRTASSTSNELYPEIKTNNRLVTLSFGLESGARQLKCLHTGPSIAAYDRRYVA